MSIISQAREFRAQFVKLREMASDEMSLQVPKLYPEWKEDVNYNVGERVLYNDVLYKVITAHTSQADWTPDVATSLFAKVLIPDENIIPEWEQPDSTNPYMAGDKVSHNGKIWVSTADGNVWEPGLYGWEEVIN
jgi:chitodextrinase